MSELFIDSANLADIKELWAWGCFTGVTTNALLMSKEKPIDVLSHLDEICKVTEVVHTDYLNYSPANQAHHVVYKVFPNELADWAWSAKDVNVTGVTNPRQLPMIMAGDVDYVSVLWGRAEDVRERSGSELLSYAQQMKKLLGWQGKIIVASVRTADVAWAAITMGADIVTASPQIWRDMLHSEATVKFMRQVEAARKWCHEGT